MMEAVIDVQDECFSDSDTDYANVEADIKKKKRKIIASPRVSRQLKKTRSESDTSNIELKSSPQKSPRSLKQQFSHNISPGKKPIISPTSNPRHIPLNTENRKDPDHIPYYLVNFECILRGVIDETDDKELFKEDELKTIEDFRTLSLDAKKLFVRLFQRKHSWLLQKAINYEEIQNIEEQLIKLCAKGFLRSSSDLNDLETILNILSSPAVKQLCKSMNIGPKGNLKKDCIEALMKHSRKKSFFTKPSDTNNTMVNVILKKARDVIESEAYHVDEQAHLIFKRVLSLYSLSNFWDERENDRGSPRQLTTILLQNTGKLTFPVYKIVRERRIFQSRDDLLEFESSCSLESDLCEQMAEKNWAEALKPAEVAVKQFQDLFVNLDKMEYTKSLPVYLRRFTNGSVLAYVITKGVEIYERLKDYDNAVRLLRQLLSQDVFLSDYHGHWYERLILDLDQHLKKPKDAIDAIWQGLNDPFVQEARLFTLCQRFLKLSSSKKKSAFITVQEKQKFIDHNRWLAPQEPQTLTIQGRMMPKSNRPGEKTVFVAEGAENDLLCSVEEFVREHYKRHEGFTNGIHAESSVIITIATVLFWDIIYDTEVPDVFRSPQQATPLDMNSPEFYLSRKKLIDERLEQLAEWSFEQIEDQITERWESSSNITACPANWGLFTSLVHFLGLVKCFSGHQLSGICRRLMTNHRHTRSGFPDLTLWDVNKNRHLFVEVKGPNDRLSNKQILWLDYLSSVGIEAVVCHIEPLNGKRLQKYQRKDSPQKNGNDVTKEHCKDKYDSEDDFQ